MTPTSTLTRHSRYDAVVVGARCAGAATALLLARRGLRVLAVERSRHGSDTLSTHALMRAGVLQLHRWGVLPAIVAAKTPPITRTAFHYGDEVVEVEIRPRDGVDALYAPRRTVLDALLQEAAWSAGAEVLFGARVVDLPRDGDGRVRGAAVQGPDGAVEEVAADLVIGADGLRSTVARLVDAETLVRGRHASGVIFGYWPDLPVEFTHWHYRPGMGAGVIPTNDGRVCLFVSTSSDRYRDELRTDLEGSYRRLVAELDPELAAALPDSFAPGSLRAFTGAPGHLRRSSGPGWALVGDAGYFKDPITAHGMTDALRDAELLARAVCRGGEDALSAYQAERDELARPFLEISDRIAAYDWTLEEVKPLHMAMSREMNREVALLLELDREHAPEDARGADLARSA